MTHEHAHIPEEPEGPRPLLSEVIERNIRTITLHNPVAYKARVIGQNLLHGTPVPANAYF